MLKNGDVYKLDKEEVINAHKKANQIMKEYLLPLGAFEDE
jgi:hypothetical protein